MAEESRSSYGVLFQNLKDRGLSTPKLIISDVHSGLVSAIRESFPGASWQRCKVHFMRNILAYVPQKEKKSFAETLKEIWQGWLFRQKAGKRMSCRKWISILC